MGKLPPSDICVLLKTNSLDLGCCSDSLLAVFSAKQHAVPSKNALVFFIIENSNR